MQRQQVLISALIATVVFVGLVIVLAVIFRPAVTTDTPEVAEQINVLEGSTNDCVECHRSSTPGIVQQYGHSTMAAANVTCENCHEVAADAPNAIEHEGTWVVNSPSPAMCQECHAAEVAQFNQSRHALPAYVAVAGAEELSAQHLDMYLNVTEGHPDPNRARNAIAALEGDALTPFTCYGCHNVGRPQDDGSVGECQACHLRHTFSLEQARKPETCNACHIGPDHPQWEIYQESPHGIAYLTDGHNWNWEAEPGTLTVEDFPAPTCATCHFSGFGSSGTSHDVGERLTWFLFSEVSERRPSWRENAVRMQGVCLECHNQNFIETFYRTADLATERVNIWTVEGRELATTLMSEGVLTSAPFDQPIDFTIFNLWHHWGRTAKFGVWMQGPDYSQWHGAYEVLHDLAEVREFAEAHLEDYDAAEAYEAALPENIQLPNATEEAQPATDDTQTEDEG